MTDDDHPNIPVGEWDGRHIDWETETCTLCGSQIDYVGNSISGHIRCSQSLEVLFQP